MVADGGDALVLEKIDGLFHAIDGGRINNDVAVGIIAQNFKEKRKLLDAVALADQITQVRTMKAGNVFIRLAEMELGENVSPDVFGCAGGEGGDGAVGKALAQAAELAVFGAEFVSPLGDAVGFVNGEKLDGHLLEPTQRIGTGEALGRKIKQAISSGAGVADDFGLLVVTEKAIQHRRRDSHLRELRGLVLHQRNQRRDHHRSALRDYRRQLVAE